MYGNMFFGVSDMECSETKILMNVDHNSVLLVKYTIESL